MCAKLNQPCSNGECGNHFSGGGFALLTVNHVVYAELCLCLENMLTSLSVCQRKICISFRGKKGMCIDESGSRKNVNCKTKYLLVCMPQSIPSH